MNTTSPAVILPVVLAAALAGARAQIVPVAPVLDDEPKRWALIANTANDFYPMEASGEINEMLYALNLGLNPFPLQDRDGFPAQALQAYYVLRDTLGYPDDRITLMLYHDDAVGNSFCEIPVTLGPDNDVLGDQFVDPRGVPRGAGVNWLWGPDGLPLTPDDPAIDFDTAAVTKANLRSAVLALGAKATVEDEVVIYLIDHGSDAAGGGSGRLWFENGPDSVTGDEFDQWLDQAFCGHYPRRLVVLADFCFASSFLWPLQVDEGCGEKNRIVVSAADAQQYAHYNMDAFLLVWNNGWPCAPWPTYSGSFFFNRFWQAIAAGKGLQEAYDFGWTSPTCWFANRVGPLQNPQLFDRGLTRDVRFDLMVAAGNEIWNHVAWRHDSDRALLVGAQGVVAKYFWGPPAVGNPTQEFYQTTVLRAANAANPGLWGVAWHPLGSEALCVGESGTILRWNGASFTAVPPATTADATTANLYAVAYSPNGSTANLLGVRALVVGDSGTILAYNGATYRRVRPSGSACAVWTAPTAAFRAVAFNPQDGYVPPPVQGAPATFVSEAAIGGFGGAWQYTFKSFEYAGQPTLNYTCERVVQFHTDSFCSLWGVAWDPVGSDTALLCGRWAPPVGAAVGLVVKLDATNAVTSALTNVQNEVLYEVAWKPNGAYAVIAGTGGAILRHDLGPVNNFVRYGPNTNPAVPTNASLRGIDWKRNGAHAIAVGNSRAIARYEERHGF